MDCQCQWKSKKMHKPPTPLADRHSLEGTGNTILSNHATASDEYHVPHLLHTVSEMLAWIHD